MHCKIFKMVVTVGSELTQPATGLGWPLVRNCILGLNKKGKGIFFPSPKSSSNAAYLSKSRVSFDMVLC